MQLNNLRPEHKKYTNGFENINFTQPIEDGLNQITGTLRNIALLGVGSMFAKNLLNTLAQKFFETSSWPVKIHYTDWWPHTCQKTKEFSSTFWSRRVEGATMTGLSSSALIGAWAYSDLHPAIGAVWNLAKDSSQSCFNLFGFKDNINLGNGLIALWTLPSIIGLGTSLALGSYDIIRKNFDPDRALETKPIFNETLQAELDEILATTCTLKEEKGFCQNLLLYGPPGTGKTMISKWIATHSKMNYIIMSGGDLLKTMNPAGINASMNNQAGAAVDMLQKLIGHAKNLPSPTVVFIDEAEACFGNRDTAKSQQLVSLLNAFLELTGQPTSKMMLILATNRPKDIDSAALSRMDYKIYIGAPEFAERKKIVIMNIKILINSPEDRRLFTNHLIDHLAQQTEGLSGRDIFKLINRLKVEIRQSRILTSTSIDRVLERFVRQEQQIELHRNTENPLKNNPFYVKQTAESIVKQIS